MLFLLFQAGADRYAIDATRVVEVLPLLDLKRIPKSPRGVAGLFNYRGRLVPAVDVCDLASGTPARPRMSTRIVVVRYPDASGNDHLLGLIAERATSLLRKHAEDTGPAVRIEAAPYLGAVMMDGDKAIHRIHEQRLLPEKVRDMLFSEIAGLESA